MEKIKQRKILLPEVQDMNLLNNFFKKLNNPVPAFVHTKLEKENNTEPSLSTKPKTTFRDVAGLEEIKEELLVIIVIGNRMGCTVSLSSCF